MLSSPAALLLEHGRLVAGLGSGESDDGGVLIDDNGRIAWVGEMADAPEISGQIRKMDVSGMWILPGFIDCHVHLSNASAERDPFRSASLPSSYLTLSLLSSMRKTLNAGVTSVRDLGGTDLGIKMAVEEGIVDGPRLQIAITPISTTGGHGDQYYPSGLDLGRRKGQVSGIADGVDECRKRAREILRAGADVIKVFSTGGVWSPRDQPDDEGLSVGEISTVVEEAYRHRRKKVASHAQGRDGIANAVTGGVASVEHGYQIDESTVEAMISRGTYLVPTLTTVTTEPDPNRVPAVSYEKKMRWMEIARACLPYALTSGVKVALGTDCGIVDHGRNLTELRRLVEFGLTPLEALLAGTQNAADLLGWQEDVGSLSIGKFGDVVVSLCDPVKDIAKLEDEQNIAVVIKGGVVQKNSLQSQR